MVDSKEREREGGGGRGGGWMDGYDEESDTRNGIEIKSERNNQNVKEKEGKYKEQKRKKQRNKQTAVLYQKIEVKIYRFGISEVGKKNLCSAV